MEGRLKKKSFMGCKLQCYENYLLSRCIDLQDKELYKKSPNVQTIDIESDGKEKKPSVRNPFKSLFKDNPILDAGKEFNEIMSEWQMGEKCKTCQEGWFEQRNNDEGNCKRCASEIATAKRTKDYSEVDFIPTFSDKNDMIPSPIPEVLACH